MTQRLTVALDAMGGDHGPAVTVPAALKALREHPDLDLILVGDEAVLEQHLRPLTRDVARIRIHHASQVVAMDDLPSHALRNKKDSSMRVAINLVKKGEADACVSAGNTGALMATARFVLKTLPGIDRPAICTALPTMNGDSVHILDLGANVDSSAGHLLEFGLMGSVLVSSVEGAERPRVGLLNIGEEEMKGNERVKEAARLLAESPLNYVGNVEGDGVFRGEADVVVCDGFVGNVALKTTEGVARMISHFMKQAFTRNWLTRLAAVVAMPVLNSLRRQIDPRRYNGASLLGLRGIVVKSHGGADALSYANAIKIATLEVRKNVPERISAELEKILTGKESS